MDNMISNDDTRRSYDYREGYRKGLSDGKESVRKLQEEVLNMFEQVNYKYIVVTQEQYDAIKVKGKLV